MRHTPMLFVCFCASSSLALGQLSSPIDAVASVGHESHAAPAVRDVPTSIPVAEAPLADLAIHDGWIWILGRDALFVFDPETSQLWLVMEHPFVLGEEATQAQIEGSVVHPARQSDFALRHPAVTETSEPTTLPLGKRPPREKKIQPTRPKPIAERKPAETIEPGPTDPLPIQKRRLDETVQPTGPLPFEKRAIGETPQHTLGRPHPIAERVP
jgi:hypothetical protein